MCFLTIWLKTSWTWLEPSEKMGAHPYNISAKLPFCYFLSLSVCHTQTHTETYTYAHSQPSRSIKPYTPISTFMRYGLHMPLISTYCCLIYLSQGLTLHLLFVNQPSLPWPDGPMPLQVSSRYTQYKWQLPLLYGNSLTTVWPMFPYPPSLKAWLYSSGSPTLGGSWSC